MTRIALDELPRFSPWPARLMGLAPWEPLEKNRQEVLREYEGDKWGPLLARVRAADRPVSLDEVDRWAAEGSEWETANEGDFLLRMKVDDARRRWVDTVAEALLPYLPAPGLVELGSGYGMVLLRLAARSPHSSGRILGAELTRSGQALLRCLSDSEELDVDVGACDLAADPVTDLPVPVGAVVYTSFAAHYLPEVDAGFVTALSALRPSVVVHFEPLFEHCAEENLLGLLRRRYIQVNGYNTNLATVLHEAAAAGRIRILEERPSVFGINALLPASVMAWAPTP